MSEHLRAMWRQAAARDCPDCGHLAARHYNRDRGRHWNPRGCMDCGCTSDPTGDQAIRDRTPQRVTAMPMNPPADLRYMIWDGGGGHNPAIVAVSGKEAIGFLGYMYSMFGNMRHRTDMLYVHPDWRRKGIATLLYRTLARALPGVQLDDHRSDDAEAWVNSEMMSEHDKPQRDLTFDKGAAELRGKQILDKIQAEVFMDRLQLLGSKTAAFPIPAMPDAFYHQQKPQYPSTGQPNSVQYMRGDLPGGDYVNCLMAYDDEGKLVGFLNHFPKTFKDGIYVIEEKDDFTVFVDPKRRREGIGKRLVNEALKRWPSIDLDNQKVTPAGQALIRNLR